MLNAVKIGNMQGRLPSLLLIASMLLPYAKLGPCSSLAHEHDEASTGHAVHQATADSPSTAAASCHIAMGCGVVAVGPVQAGPQTSKLSEQSTGARISPPSGYALELESPLTPPPKA